MLLPWEQNNTPAIKTPKGHKETFGGGRCVHYLNCGDGSQLHACVQIQKIIYIKRAVLKIPVIPQ